MSRFADLWKHHPGRSYVCDFAVFENQCAMRMGAALHAIGVDLRGLKTCVDYDRRKYGAHVPGHVRSAQDLADRFYRKPKAHGLDARSFEVLPGNVAANLVKLKDRNGMIFIMNGWGRTDHIDVWKGNGSRGTLKGGFDHYFNVGTQVWFWAFD